MEPALEIMVDAYTRLDLPQLAEDAQRVLVMNEEAGNFVSEDDYDKNWFESFWDWTGLDEN